MTIPKTGRNFIFCNRVCALSSIEAAATVSPLFHFLVPLKRKTTLLLLYYTRRLLFFFFFSRFWSLPFQLDWEMLSHISFLCCPRPHMFVLMLTNLYGVFQVFLRILIQVLEISLLFFFIKHVSLNTFITRFICDTTISER